MKLKVFDTSSLFFGRSIALTSSTTEEEYNTHHAAWTIQRWWKQLYLKRTAIESAHYLHDVVSLEQAKHETFSELEKFLLDPKTQDVTRQLLTHLEETKDVILAERMTLPNMHHSERQFLIAYLIATQSELMFESPTEVDSFLLERAQEMLKSFEALCAFMGETYLERTEVSASPIAEQTPSADLVLAHLEGSEAVARVRHDHRFMEEGKALLETFHLSQIAYYETLTKWEVGNRHKLANILINQYLKLEAKCFTLLHSLDPRMIELHEGYCNQQRTLKSKIRALLKDEGVRMLDEQLATLHTSLEANKWLTSPIELLTHEIALNPHFQLPADACIIRPQKNIDEAIATLTQESPNHALILDVLEEIREKIALFTPNNRRQIAELRQLFSREAMQKELDEMGLANGLYRIIFFLIEKIKGLESPGHVPETNSFLEEMAFNMSEHGGSGTLLKECIDFIYHKMSQMTLEINNFKIRNAAHAINRSITVVERKYFEERLAAKQFDLGFVLAWIDKFIAAPEHYRLNLDLFCSKYIGTYVAHALLINVLQQPVPSILKTIPETFYLDRLRLIDWHAQYQKILYMATALGYLETCCKEHGITLSIEDLRSEKIRLGAFLAREVAPAPKEKATEFITTINRLLSKAGKKLSAADEHALSGLIEKTASEPHRVTNLIATRLSDHLSSYLYKGHPPTAVHSVIKRYELEPELNQLGKDILPVMRLHNKVYSSFYQQQIEQKLWKPLFTLLKETKLPTELPLLFASEEESLKEVHNKIHKLGFVLAGLALIQQTVACSDMWNRKIIKNSALKALAYSSGLIDLVKNPSSTKEEIEAKLMDMAKQVTTEQEVPFDEHEMTKMLRLAKSESSPGCKAFLTELTTICKQKVLSTTGLPSNPKNLIAEFEAEFIPIISEVKTLVKRAKEERLGSDLDPVAPVIPVLRAGLTVEERTNMFKKG